jgi:hypothetical protein
VHQEIPAELSAPLAAGAVAPTVATRLRRTNLVAAIAFTIGGSLFAIGAWVAQVGSGAATTAACIYFAGGLFFNTGGYASVVLASNKPGESWRWWGYEPYDLAWLSAFVLFAGTIAFGISLLDSFLDGLTTQGENRLIWAPEVVGCILFLISGRIGLRDVGRRPRWDLGWGVVAINQLGSILFMISALAAFIRPETSSVVNIDVANWGTFTGALCFAIGGVMQAFDPPET